MKNLLILGGIALAAYGCYLYYEKQKNPSGGSSSDGSDSANQGATNSQGTPAVVNIIDTTSVVPDSVLERFDTRFDSIFHTPPRKLGVGHLSINTYDPFNPNETAF